jgi:hypothetical protein
MHTSVVPPFLLHLEMCDSDDDDDDDVCMAADMKGKEER